MNGRITVAGSINMDLVARVDRMPGLGETLHGKAFAMHPGGKGANQAVAAARLGADVAMIGRLGHDLFGETLLQELKGAGVDVANVHFVDSSTGCAVILVDAQGANSITVVAGANYDLQPSDLVEATIAESSIVLAQLEVPLATVIHAAEIAHSAGVPFVLDPAPASFLPRELLQKVTWLTPNETEALVLFQDLHPAEPVNSITNETAPTVARALLNAGVQNVILKMGKQGVYVSGKDIATTMVNSFAVNAVDTTAAGDTFNGAFAHALTEGQTQLDAVRFACAAASISVSRHGAQPSMPYRAEVGDLLSRSQAV